jgi:ABC-2 type transport system ATP-binding protein
MDTPSVRRQTRSTRIALSTRGLTKDFGKVRALDSLDLEIARGEIFGYLGPNGAGKTTTIRVLLDFIRPTSGDVRILGRSPDDASIRRRIGYIPGDVHIDPRYTARDVVDYFSQLRGDRNDQLIAELFERFELDPTKRFGEMSSGNRRKVGVIQAFMHRPDLLLLDEPTAGLDPLLQREFRELVGTAVANGATVLLSSHVLHEVEHLADRVAILRRGRLVTISRIDELRKRARQRIELHMKGKADPTPFAHVRGVVEATADGSVVSLVIRGAVEHVLAVAGRLHVQRIVTHQADLEDVFLDYYREDAA